MCEACRIDPADSAWDGQNDKGHWTMSGLAAKIDYEGGIDGMMGYQGRELQSCDTEVNAAWAHAYDVHAQLQVLLTEKGATL